MVTNAVAFNMGCGTNTPVQRSESENGFSDVLDSVNKASPKASKAEGGEKFAYTETRGQEQAKVTENASPEMSEKAGEILDSAVSSLKKAFSELAEKLKNETDEDAKNEIISALLELLKKFKSENEDREDISGVIELLMTVLVPAENSDVSDAVSEAGSENSVPVIEAYSAVDEKTGEIRLINANAEVQAETSENNVPEGETAETISLTYEAVSVENAVSAVQSEEAAVSENGEAVNVPEALKTVAPQTTESAEIPEAAESAEVPETLETADVPETTEKLERLLDDILSKAKKELGLTEAKLSSSNEVSEKLSSMPLSFNVKHSDRSGELGEILGKNTPEAAEVKNVETKTETDTAVHLAANLFDNAGNVTARINNQPVITEASETAPPEVQTANEILARMENLSNGETEFTMVLNPESLGRITVKLVTSGEKVAVQITAENPETGKLLEARTENLTAMLRDNGVELERYQVVSEGESAELMQDSYDGSSKNPYSRQEEQQNDENNEEESFFDLLQSI